MALYGLYGYRWDDQDCANKMSFICEMEAMYVNNILWSNHLTEGVGYAFFGAGGILEVY